MTITPTGLTRAAGAAAAAAGTIFIAVQIGHPQLNATTVVTTNVEVRDSLKVLMAALALAGIAGMYLSQIRRNGRLGLLGYLLFSTFYLISMCTSFVAAFVLPTIAVTGTAYVNDVTAVATSRPSSGDIGSVATVIQVQGFGYLAGGLIFGIALYRAHVLARWATVLLVASGLATVVLSQMPDAFYRLLAFPNAIAMIGLGVSLWRSTRRVTDAASTTAPSAGETPVR